MTDFCGRCLVQVNSTSYVAASFTEGGEVYILQAPNITHPPALAEWAESIMQRSGGDAKFEMNGSTGHLVPFATWHGDSVCSYHLWVLVEADRKEHRYW